MKQIEALDKRRTRVAEVLRTVLETEASGHAKARRLVSSYVPRFDPNDGTFDPDLPFECFDD